MKGNVAITVGLVAYDSGEVVKACTGLKSLLSRRPRSRKRT